MVIKYRALNHPGGFYAYRIHNDKTISLCTTNKFRALHQYLDAVFSECPDDYFHSGPRSSALKFKTNQDIIEIRGHEVSALAKYGLLENQQRFKDNHSRVQMFMLEHDSNTVAMEVPLWLYHYELEGYQEIFNSTECLSGHIDVLRVDDGKIWIWDYKPNAHKEKYADTQVYFYSIMLSKRTGIPLEHFRCGYFDDKYAYMFKPREHILSKNATHVSY